MKNILAMAPEGKGGVGKSLLMQTVAATLQSDGSARVAFLDTDTTNSSLISVVDAEEARFVNLRRVESAGTIANSIKRMADGAYDHIVLDVGARDEVEIIRQLPLMAAEAKRARATIIAFRPINLSSQVQRNAVAFAENIATKYNVKTIFVRNLGQGRSEEDFAHWNTTRGRARALKSGVVEIDMEDAGARWGDEAAGFGLTVAEAALGRFERAGDDAADAARIFTDDIQAWLSIWLERQTAAIRAAIQRVLN